MTASQDAALQTVFVDRRAQKRLLKKTRLRVVEGQDAGKTVDARRERVTIGRSVICDFPLTDASVSSNHCEIVAREDGFLLRDLESTNGVFVRDVRVREAFIAPGMTFRVGQTRVALEDTPGTIDIHLSQRERYFDLVGVSVAMREVRIATCTSGEPVSPSLVANSLIRRCFSSTVIDIGVSCVKRVKAQSGMSSRKGPWRIRPAIADGDARL